MAAVPFCPSLVAVIVAEPAAFAVTNPLPLTLATPLLPLAHVTTRPDNALPVASLGVALSCTVTDLQIGRPRIHGHRRYGDTRHCDRGRPVLALARRGDRRRARRLGGRQAAAAHARHAGIA